MINIRRVVIMLLAALSLCGLSSCLGKKNTAARRQYTAFITRYNIYYNGDLHYKETLDEMERSYEDDYSRLVFMHPVEAKSDPLAPQPSGSFNRSIEKAQKAIQVRSIKQRPQRKGGKNSPEYKAWLKRDEYNPFLHNAWMMMGRSQYYNGDFLGAASTFFYISRHFTWLPKTVTEAKLWQAQSYVSLGWLFEAEMIITRIKQAELTDKTLRGLYNRVYADYEIKAGDFEKAEPYLREAIKASSGPQKTRLNFLLGQVYMRLGQKKAAYEAFKKAGSASSAPYRTKFNARIKQSEVFEGSDISSEVKALKRMTRYDRNKEYLDQIYYAIGNLYLSRRDTNKAIENYVLAAEKSMRNGIDKAVSQVTLGGLYFDRHQYEKAQPCYAEAIPQLPETFPDYKLLKRRSDVLDELALYSQNVTLQDSLLRLSRMTPEQQLEVVNKIIEELVKKEKEEAENARREEYLASQAAQGDRFNNGNAAQAPNSFNINTDNSWYFYNTATRNSGKTEFQRRWGSRKLEDDWRRRNKATFNVNDFDADSDRDDALADSIADGGGSPDDDNKKDASADDPHFPEYYLSQIPKTDEERQTCNDIIQEGLYNMGVILKDKLEDFPASMSEFDRLLKDYPDNVYRLDVYYNIYLMYMREGKTAEAERYRRLIIDDFPESKYGTAMRDPQYIENLKTMDARQQLLYEQTYDDYLNNRNDRVHSAYAEMSEKYPLSKIMPKFMFLHALAYVTENRPEEFNAVLRDMLERYPDTDITPIAAAWLKGMAQGRKLHAGSGGNLRGMFWDIRLSENPNDSTSLDPVVFDLDPNTKQLLVFVYDTAEVPGNALIYEIARHNFKSFVVKDFDIEQMNFGRLGMVIVRGFDSLDELNHYRRVMAASDEFKLPKGVRPIPMGVGNFEKLINEGRSFDDYFKYLESQNYIDAQAGLLQPEEIETLNEADEAADERLKDSSGGDIIVDGVLEEVTDDEEEKPEKKVDKPELKDEPKQLDKPEQKKEAPRQPEKPKTPVLPAYDPGNQGDEPDME
ncbi:MAG: tetratricopeptide repeat protein [Muribaculaceae bacterium]